MKNHQDARKNKTVNDGEQKVEEKSQQNMNKIDGIKQMMDKILSQSVLVRT